MGKRPLRSPLIITCALHSFQGSWQTQMLKGFVMLPLQLDRNVWKSKISLQIRCCHYVISLDSPPTFGFHTKIKTIGAEKTFPPKVPLGREARGHFQEEFATMDATAISVSPSSFPSWVYRNRVRFFLLLLFFRFIFIYLFLAALGLCCCPWAFSSCGKWGLFFVAMHRLLAVEHEF